MNKLISAAVENLGLVAGSLILLIFLVAMTVMGINFAKSTQNSMSKATQLSYGVEE